MTQISTMVWSHLEPDILECEESITRNKASGGDGISAELFQIPNDDAVKVLHSIMSANLENSAVATGLEKVSVYPISKKSSVKECSNYFTVALISHVSKVMLKIL